MYSTRQIDETRYGEPLSTIYSKTSLDMVIYFPTPARKVQTCNWIQRSVLTNSNKKISNEWKHPSVMIRMLYVSILKQSKDCWNRSWKPVNRLGVQFNSLNVKLNPTCHSLTSLGAHPIPHVSRVRVKITSVKDL